MGARGRDMHTALASVMYAGKSQRLTVVSAGVRVFERLGEKQASDPELQVTALSHLNPGG
jgi:hypothetical protein